MQTIPPNLASTGQRLFTFVLDFIFILFCAVLFGGFMEIAGLGKGVTDAGFNLIGSGVYLLYYFFQEAVDGKTLGKRIVGTRVVSFDGGDIGVGQALGRTFCRLIPFEVFSYFGNDFKPTSWHDSIPKTYVVVDDASKRVSLQETKNRLVTSDSHPLNAAARNVSRPLESETSKPAESLFSKPLPPQVSATAQTPVATFAQATDDLWESAMAECTSEQRKAGLWARCFAETDGDENKAQARYIKHRVAEEQQRVEDERQAALLATLAQAKRDAEQIAKDQALADSMRDKGYCPNCSGVVFLDAVGCVYCKAVFGGNSLWKPREYKPALHRKSLGA